MTAWWIALALIAHPAGWRADDLDGALASVAPDGVVLVDVSADWCGPCQQLAREVLDTPAGAALLGAGDVGVLVDFESTAGRAIAERLTVINLPTTLLLDAHGGEVGRVEGYGGRQAWLDAIADVRAGRAGLDALSARAAAAPRDPDRAIDLAWARLAHGEEAAAVPVLVRLARRGDAAGARAGRVLGRWYLRVRHDAVAARDHFLRMVKRYRATPFGPGFRYWLAASLHALGARDAALAVFERWRREAPRSADPSAYLADFMVQYGYPLEDAEPAVRAALARDPEDPSLHHLLAKVLAARRDLVGAHAAIDRALALAPDEALFANFKASLPHAPTSAPADAASHPSPTPEAP